MADAVWLVQAIAREAMLFAGAGFLIGGLDDLAVDLLWLRDRLRRRFAAPQRLMDIEGGRRRSLAIFVAAWREEAVIEAMLRSALSRIDYPDYRIFVGTYPNDPATIRAVSTVALIDARVRLVVGDTDGPTTKADNLNVLWSALQADDEQAGRRTAAVILHDAEDLIHADELSVHDAMLTTHAVIQTPVVPLIDTNHRMVSGHYADEFAESHGKGLVVRAALGAGLPLAGVGCAIRTDALAAIAARDGSPFDAGSLTEDYELGLRLSAMDLPACFARVLGRDGTLVATRAYFPSTISAAVTQKARWMVGIALAGWDRMGWSGMLDLREHWMRMRDRRAPLALLVLATAYFALVLWVLGLVLGWLAGVPGAMLAPWMRAMLLINGLLLAWRSVVRASVTASAYGWQEGARSIPRMAVANYIALLAVSRALRRYAGIRAGQMPRWDKTDHVFPDGAINQRCR